MKTLTIAIDNMIAEELKASEEMNMWNPINMAIGMSEKGFSAAIAVPLTGTERQIEYAKSIIVTYINQARVVLSEAAVRVQNNEMPSRWIFNLKDALVYELLYATEESLRIHNIMTTETVYGLPATDIINAKRIKSIDPAIERAEKIYNNN